VIEVTTPAVIDAVATAVVPSPTDCAVFPILTVGVVEYPTPPEEMEIEDIVPSPETIAVAAGPSLSVLRYKSYFILESQTCSILNLRVEEWSDVINIDYS
tara:strand:+ start:150 stop:449 length:300 start_codon:yes stop_codon:yes gene_type:complete